MLEINLIVPKRQIRHPKWIFAIWRSDKYPSLWASLTVKQADNPDTRPSYYNIAKVKGVYSSEDN